MQQNMTKIISFFFQISPTCSLKQFYQFNQVFNGHDSHIPSLMNKYRPSASVAKWPQLGGYSPKCKIGVYLQCVTKNPQKQAKNELKQSFGHNTLLFEAFVGCYFNIFQILFKKGEVQVVGGLMNIYGVSAAVSRFSQLGGEYPFARVLGSGPLG